MSTAQELPVIGVLTTTRADYGILKPLLQALKKDQTIHLQVIVSGTHLSSQFGRTIQEIQADYMPIAAELPILEDAVATPQDMTRVMARAMTCFSDYLKGHRMDLLVVLGDRYETFAFCAAAACSCVPIAHLHGGETTEGLMDECFRHSITKMSFLHFTATEAYRNRVIQLGEAPERVFNVGALGVENAMHVPYLSAEEIEARIEFPIFSQPCVIVTFHPVTLESGDETAQTQALLKAMEAHPKLNFLITKSNADIGGQKINQMFEEFARSHANCCCVASLGMRCYMSCLKQAACVLGNSSSGLIEVPSFGIPTVNIGNRQRGRIQADSVICCGAEYEAISKAIDQAMSPAFQIIAKQTENPYGDGNTSEKIVNILLQFLSSHMDLKKKFYDIDFEVKTDA